MRKILIAAAVLGATVVSAAAADMAVKAPYTKAPELAPVYDWSGFYIGGDLGGQWSDIGISSTTGPLTYGFRHDSFAAGVHGGYQRQWGQLVLGVEGGYTAAFDQSDQQATPSISIFIPGGTGTSTAKLRDIWSFGGRIGFAQNTWLFYATGGYASGSFAFDVVDNRPSTEHASAFPDGYYIGGGVEYAVTQNWIVGAEYRHYGFNSKSVASTTTGFVGGFSEPVNFDTKTDVVMGRVSYKFNWGGPVVAKY
jgi:outer membrane immunogenic protein